MTYSWLDKTAYPFTSHYFDVNGHSLHYIEEGKGDMVLFVHGTPSWSFDFRHVIMSLEKDFRCVAVDHIGFGLSAKPARYDYSTQNHSKTLEKFILEKNLENITLVVHDFGGPIGLSFAIRHPERIKKIIILNSWLWSSRNDPDFKKLSKLLKSPLLPFLYRYLNFSPRYILPRSFGDHPLSGHTLRQYIKPFAYPGERHGPLAFARSLVNDQEWFEELWNKKEILSAKPTLFLWGMKDPVIKPQNLEKFISGFPGATVQRFETSGHFPQEEEPGKVSAAISQFIRS